MNTINKTQMTGGVSTRPETQVEVELNEGANLMKELHQSIQQLSERLRSVSRMVPKDEYPTNPREILVPLADNLRELNDSARGAINEINYIRDCVEVPIYDSNQLSKGGGASR